MSPTDALQQALAAEHAIIYGYGAAGAHLRHADLGYARASVAVHQERRDRLVRLLTRSGATPVAAETAYHLPFPVTDPASARRLAAAMESAGCGRAWDLLAAGARGSTLRSLGSGWLDDAVLRIERWGAALPPLPGQPV